MPYPYYTGEYRDAGTREPVILPGRDEDLFTPEGYIPDEGLVDAVNVALELGQPLLLTGEPGTGKTQLAYSLAHELGYGKPLKFETKSTSVSRDLFYTYDTIGRFHAAQLGEYGPAAGPENEQSARLTPEERKQANRRESLGYLDYNALGKAIVLANDPPAVAAFLPPGFVHPGRRRSVVLIDEVDKAPRDFPNDILNELEEMYFKVPELGNAVINAGTDMRPVLVITSNSEKHLPDAFLRRCIYYNIPFPGRARMVRILKSRIKQLGKDDDPFIGDALAFFYQLRESGSGLRKPPATAELLGWVSVLKRISGTVSNPLQENRQLVESTLNCLIKTETDQQRALEVWREWKTVGG